MKRPYFTIGLLGILVILMSVVLMFVFPAKIPMPAHGFRTPIIAFEFAESQKDLEGLFGPPGGPEREAIKRKMDLGNGLDYLYMLLYASFLFLFSKKARKLNPGTRTHCPAMALAILALFADGLENMVLFSITRGLDSGDLSAELSGLRAFTWIKWGALTAVFAFLAPGFFQQGGLSKIPGILAVPCVILACAAFFRPGTLSEIFALNVALLFVALILYCFLKKGEQALPGERPEPKTS